MHWIYLESPDHGVWTVGFFKPNSREWTTTRWEWHSIADYGDELEAQRMVNYLNGGEGKGFPKRIA
jgi:hypothetical protein